MPAGDDRSPAARRPGSAPSSARRRGSARSTRPGATPASRTGDSVFMELAGCVARYHAPLGRLVHVGRAPDTAREHGGGDRGRVRRRRSTRMQPGALFRDVYAAWQGVVDRAGLSHYRRHHCGYVVGIGVPPSWTGGNRVTGLRRDSDIEVKAGHELPRPLLADGNGARRLLHLQHGAARRERARGFDPHARRA